MTIYLHRQGEIASWQLCTDQMLVFYFNSFFLAKTQWQLACLKDGKLPTAKSPNVEKVNTSPNCTLNLHLIEIHNIGSGPEKLLK